MTLGTNCLAGAVVVTGVCVWTNKGFILYAFFANNNPRTVNNLVSSARSQAQEAEREREKYAK